MTNIDEIEAKYREDMRQLGRILDQVLNPDPKNKTTGFCLLMFDFGDQGRMNYISNAVREDMIKALGEFLTRAKGEMKETDNLN